MRSTYTRGPDRLFLIHHVLGRLRDRGWFSPHQATRATYFGIAKPHRQQRKRVRQMLDQYVEAGILERSDLWECPLYRHRCATLKDVDREMVKAFEAHANRQRMTPSDELNVTLLDHYLDQVVPRDPDPELFNEHGHLMDRELKVGQERPKVEAERPRVLGYLSPEW